MNLPRVINFPCPKPSRLLYKHYQPYQDRYVLIQWWTRRDVVLARWVKFTQLRMRENIALFLAPWLEPPDDL
jgi:hypothetical protein